MKGFGSDNHAGTHPELLSAIVASNLDHAPSYGTDDISLTCVETFQNLFQKNVDVFFVYNGTAANVISLRALVKNYQSVLVSDISHLNVDECGAPEFIAGCKLIPIKAHHGKITLAQLKEALIRRGDQHFSQIKGLSLTQPTELGTCYTIEEITEITKWAHSHGILVHIDGARIANAVQFLDCSFKEMLTDTGIDILSFGGTKNGLMMGEAIVVFNKDLSKDMIYIRKQSLHLPSKTRFIACQFERYLKDDLWKQIAAASHENALLLERLVKDVKEITITNPIQSNAVFMTLPKSWISILRKKYFFYVWDEKTFECRIMMAWDSTKEEVTDFANELRNLSRGSS